MTGAGSGEAIFGHEETFRGSLVDSDSDGTPDLYAPGRNASLTDLSLDRALERVRDPNAVEAVESIATQIEGAIEVEAAVTQSIQPAIEQWVFNDSGAFATGRASTTGWYVGVDYLDGSAARQLSGVIPLEYRLSYTGEGLATYQVTAAYASEELDVSIPTTDITRPITGETVPFHGVDLSIDGATVAKLQSATLTITDISRFHRDAQPTPVDATIAAPTATLDVEAILTGTSRTELAYGGAGATTLQDAVDSVPGELTLSVAGSPISTYALDSLTPEGTSWENVLATDDTTESQTFHVNGVSVS